MATLNSIPEHRQSPSAMRGVMDYCRQQQKVHDPVSGRDLVSGIHCGGATAFDEFMLTKQVYGKTGGVLLNQRRPLLPIHPVLRFPHHHLLCRRPRPGPGVCGAGLAGT